MLDGYQPGDPMVRVFAYQASPGRSAEEIAEEAFETFNDHPRDPAGAELACAYYGRRLRSLSVGDVVAVTADGEVPLAVAKSAGPGPRRAERGPPTSTAPAPCHPSRLPDTADRPALPCPARSDLMTIRKPNRVTTPKWAVLNGPGPAMPRCRAPVAGGGLKSAGTGPARPAAGRRPARLKITGQRRHEGQVRQDRLAAVLRLVPTQATCHRPESGCTCRRRSTPGTRAPKACR